MIAPAFYYEAANAVKDSDTRGAKSVSGIYETGALIYAGKRDKIDMSCRKAGFQGTPVRVF